MSKTNIRTVVIVLTCVIGLTIAHLVEMPARERTSPAKDLQRASTGAFEKEQVVDRPAPAMAKLRREMQPEQAANSSNVPSARAADPDAVPLSHEEELKQLQRKFADLEDIFKNDPFDPTWSREASSYLSSGLAELGKQKGFSISFAECRTERCKATLRWRDYGQALATGMQLPHTPIAGLNCARDIWLSDPEDKTTPYEASLYFDCSLQRASLVEVFR